MVDFTAAAERLKLERNAKLEQVTEKGSNEAFGTVNPGEFFVRNSVESIGSLFGMEKSDYAKEGEKQYPGVALASDLVGSAVPYVGWAKVTKAGKYAKALDNIGDAVNSPLRTGFQRGAARFAPLEAARIVGTGIQQPEELGDAFVSAGINTAIEGGFGLIGAGIKAAGKVAKQPTALFGNLKNPAQVQIRELNEAVAAGKFAKEKLPAVQNHLAKLQDAILSEFVEKGKGKNGAVKNYVKELADDGDSAEVSKLFRNLNATPVADADKGTLKRSTFASKEPAERLRLLTKSGIEGNIDSVQFPRHVQATTEKTAKAVEKNLLEAGKFTAIGDNTLWQREKDGLFVLAKKIEGKIGEHKATDEWVVFKTDSPAKFAPRSSAWNAQIEARTAFLHEKPYIPDPTKPLDIYDTAKKIADDLPFNAYEEHTTQGLFSKGADIVADKLGYAQGGEELARRGKQFVREYLAPASSQFKHSARAKYIHGVARAVFDKASENATGMVYGEQIVTGANVFKQLAKGVATGSKYKGKDSIKTILSTLDQNDVDSLLDVWNQGGDLKFAEDLFASGALTENAYNALKALDDIDEDLIDQIRRTQKVTGQKEFTPLKGHFMLSRTWAGDLRAPLTNEKGNIVYVVAGKNQDLAQKQADRIIEEAAKEGIILKAGKFNTYDTLQDIELASRVKIGSPEYQTAASLKSKIRVDASKPKTFKLRTGVEGYQTEFTKDELLSKFASHINARQTYMAELTTKDLMQGELFKLGIDDPRTYQDLTRRLNQLAGKQGELSQKQNQLVDSVLAPVLGKNSASKISSAINGSLFHLTQGMFNLAFPAINLTTFIQTVVPHMAFLRSASDASLMRHLTWYPANGSKGRPVGGIAAIDIFKVMRNTMKEMGKPDEALVKGLTRAANDGTIDPKFIEAAVGESSRQVQSLRETLSSSRDPFAKFIEGLGTVSSYLPGMSEKFSRGHAYTTGHILGRDWFNLSDDALYRFAKQFTEQTMFGYGTADRARIMTAPLGRMFGLFKNWQTHYIASMIDYAGEGFGRGNWSPLLWQMGGTVSLAGVGGLPLIYSTANAFSNWATDEPLMNHIYSAFGASDPDSTGGNASDAVYMGLPSFLGLALGNSTSAPFSDPARDAAMLFSFVQADRAKAIGSFAGAAMDKWQATGEHPIDSAEVRDKFVAAFAPKVLARAIATTQEQGIRSLNTGNKQIDGLNTAESMMYQIGFMPRRVALNHDVNEELWRQGERKKKAIQEAGKAWAEAEQEGDSDALQMIQIRAMADGVDISSILRSAKARLAKKENPKLEQQDPEQLIKFMDLGLIK